MKSSTTSILLTITLLSISLAGCSEEEGVTTFILIVANETEYDLMEVYMHEGKGAGSTFSGAGERAGTNFGFSCPNEDGPELGSEWNFTLRLHHVEGPAVGPVFAESTYLVSCGYFTAWVHPDAYIVWERGDHEDDLPPWSR